jgi:hypothetical protein
MKKDAMLCVRLPQSLMVTIAEAARSELSVSQWAALVLVDRLVELELIEAAEGYEALARAPRGDRGRARGSKTPPRRRHSHAKTGGRAAAGADKDDGGALPKRRGARRKKGGKKVANTARRAKRDV